MTLDGRLGVSAGDVFGHIYKRFADSGSSTVMRVNGSVTPVEFEYVVPAGKTARIERVNFSMTDIGIAPDKFGGVAALGNGLKFEVIAADTTTVLLDFCDGFPITTNAELALLAGTDVFIDPGSGTDGLYSRFTISKSGGPIDLTAGEALRLTVQDDLTGLVSFYAMAQGVYV